MNKQERIQWLAKWALPSISALVLAVLVAGTLSWAAAQSDEVAVARQKDLVSLIVSKMREGVAHDQESATVWDDAVRKAAEPDQEWLRYNLGEWIHTYFGHDAALVLSADKEVVHEYISPSDRAPSHDDLNAAYSPLVDALQQRLAAGDTEGVTERVLSIGESDLAYVGARPAIVSAKPIVSDSGDIEQEPGKENVHVSVRYLDGDFPAEIGKDYQFADMRFTAKVPADKDLSSVPLTARSGAHIGYFTWRPFKPGTSVMQATLPAAGVLVLITFISVALGARAVLKRSAKLAASRQKLQHLALHDTLTGLANRAHFNTALGANIPAASADQGHSVLFVDLDRFKAVNDTFGHPTGDKLIALAAKRMQEVLPGALIARMGGDEFTALLKDADPETVAAACKKIVQCLREPFEIDGTHICVGASVGAASVAGPADALELTRQADIALYHAKAAGRNTYALFGNHMDDLLRQRRGLEADLRSALEGGAQFETYYQPVYSADNKDLLSTEALARWKHPERGYIPPDVFIPIAEEMGLIDQIGMIVLEDACGVLAEFLFINMAINASPLELGSSGYALRVLSTLAKWNIRPDRLEIEITENEAIGGGGQTERNIELLRKAGVRFAIDDFGTGYSSFSRVQNINADRIKIDKTFIDAMQREDNKALVEAMISMAHAKGLKATAEGVETNEQRDALRLLGCDNLQGFLLSEPLPRSELVMMLNSEAGAVRVG
jgi:diguanylate cyclase (GGDEF)-like protein